MKWPLVALGDIFNIARGGSPRPIQKFLTDDPDGVNWVMISDATESSKYISSTKKRIKKTGVKNSRMVNPGDFLLTNSMSFGRPYIMNTSGCIHDGWLVLSSRENVVDTDYFYHLLGSNLIYLEFSRRAAGATVKNLNIDLVKEVQVPLPPLAEQQRIAAILDKADALREQRRQSLAKLDTLLQSVFLDMFGDPVTNPKRWPMSSFGEEVSLMEYGPRFYNEAYTPLGTRIVRITDLDGLGNLDFESMPRMDVSNKDKEKYCLRAGELIFARSGATVGKVALIAESDPECIAGAYFIRMRLNANIHPLFARMVLSSKSIQAIITNRSRQSAQQNFSGPGIRSLPLPIPPIETQARFEQIHATISVLAKSEHQHVKVADVLFQSLQQRAFTGELFAAEARAAVQQELFQE